jgi:hypothetical protein
VSAQAGGLSAQRRIHRLLQIVGCPQNHLSSLGG